MRKLTNLFNSLILLSLAMAIFAAPVDFDMAKTAADFHLTSHYDMWHRDGGGVPSALILGYDYSEQDIDSVMYDGEFIGFLFNLEPTGYIIVTPRTELPPVLAYSFTNGFSLQEHPLNAGLHMVQWDVSNRLNCLDKIEKKVTTENEALWLSYLSSDSDLLETYSDMEVYGPLLDTNWDQGAPYNTYCPIDPETGEVSVVGCTATAMAMVCNYYEWPPNVHFTALDNFRKEREDTFLFVEAETANMDTIDYNGAGVHPTDSVIAMLSYACGVSVDMNYHSDGSGASVNAAKMMNQWQYGYGRDIKGDDDEYNSKMANSIMNNDPAMMSIYDIAWGSGHKIVSDGYNSDDETFHLNFGWSGSSNGWYSIPRGMPHDYINLGNTNIDLDLPRYRTVRVPEDFATIQEAIDSSYSGDTIIVADGTYTGDGNRDIEFGGKAIYLKSENGPYHTILDNEATSDDRHRGFLIEKNEGPRCIIEGFTITGGVTWDGPGIFVKYSSPTFRNCIIRDQVSWSQGGAAYLHTSDSRFYNTIFTGNSSTWGGGIWMHRSRIAFVNCTITENSGRFGGGVYIQDNTKSAFLNTILHNNDASQTLDEMHILFRENKPCSVRFAYSNIRSEEIGMEDGAGHIRWGDGLLNIEPDFEDGSFIPSEGSSMIDAGGDSIFSIIEYYAPDVDIAHTPRESGTIDIGAFETDFTAENRRPNIWQCPTELIVRSGETLEFTFEASDPDGDSLSYEIAGVEGIGFGHDYEVILETEHGDSGSYEIVLTACDGSLCDTAIINVDVVNGYCGNIAGLWRAEGGPYYITCNTWLDDGDTLIIEPGCEVIFTGHYFMEIGQNAVLKALGNEVAPIQFSYHDDSELTDSTGGFSSIRFNNASEACSLAYCYISGGNARTNLPYISGGAVYINNSNITISNCIFNDNRASYFGGSVYCRYSELDFTDNEVYNNSSSDDGGGVYLTSATGRVINSEFHDNYTGDVAGALFISSSELNVEYNDFYDNSAYNHGGAIYISSHDCLIANSTFSNNVATRYHGGAIYINGSHRSEIADNEFSNNYANENGGAMHLWYSNISITSNEIYDNQGRLYGGGISCQHSHPTIEANYIMNNESENGGGIRCQDNSDPTISNNVISGNMAFAGGGIYIKQFSDPFIVNSSIFENSALTIGGGGIYFRDSCKVGIFNSIIWDNHFTPMPSISEVFGHTSECTLEVVQCIANQDEFHSDGELAFGGDIINRDPLFEDSLGHLSMYSPAVDSGTIDAWTPFENVFVAALMDIDGEPRPGGRGWDIGADESPWDAIAESKPKPDQIGLIQASPNPFNSTVNIDFNGFQPKNIEIIDYMGRIIKSINISGNNFKWQPEASNESGVYLIKANNGDEIATERVLYIK